MNDPEYSAREVIDRDQSSGHALNSAFRSFFNSKSETLLQSIFEKMFSSVVLGLAVLAISQVFSTQYKNYIETEDKRNALRTYTNDKLADLLPTITDSFYNLECVRDPDNWEMQDCSNTLNAFSATLKSSKLQLKALFPLVKFDSLDNLISSTESLSGSRRDDKDLQREQRLAIIKEYTVNFAPAVAEISANFK